ncbi:MAG: alpha/beta hydrolase [Nitrosomonadales bacterium]|nr:alpha/beta hydrolase [Nitrosomonadales bacterium]
MRMMWHVLGILAAAYCGFALLLYFSQSRLVYYPETGRGIIATPERIGLPYEEIRLTTSDGVGLYGWFVPAARPRGTVLFLHGNAGNISHRLDSVRMFNRLGYNTLIFDYRGYGNSGGTPTEQGTYLDADAAWLFLTGQRQLPACRIVVFGESMGGAIAAQLASRQKPAALVIASGFTSVPDLAQHIYPYLPVKWLARIRYDTKEYLRKVSAPVLIAHSPQDEIIPYAHGQALFAAANPPKQFLELAGGHNDGFIFMREDWVGVLGDFLDKQTDAACVR